MASILTDSFAVKENESAIQWGKKALDLAETLQETEIAIHAMTNIATAELYNGDESGRARMERALTLAKEHEMHHRGQLMMIERMVGVVPHLTRQMQERMARVFQKGS